jgi:hypothetical protein
MAQLRDSTIDGNLDITGNIILKTNGKGVQSIHPETGEVSRTLYMDEHGNTIIGYDNYVNQSGDSNIYGNDVTCHIASAGNSNFRPYYRAGDVISFTGNNAVRTAGYVTNAGKNVVFTIHVPKPVIGSPNITVTSGQGFVLRQNGNYTHGSAASTFVKPTSYSVVLNNSGFVVTAVFDVTTNVVNNDTTGVYWDGTITLS